MDAVAAFLLSRTCLVRDEVAWVHEAFGGTGFSQGIDVIVGEPRAAL